MITEEVDFKDGVIELNNFIYLDDKKPLYEQLEKLQGEMLQVRYGKHLLLEVSWAGFFTSTGQFEVQLLHNDDSGYPLYQRKIRSRKWLYKMLQFIIDDIVPDHQC